jgi:hypothetical protein
MAEPEYANAAVLDICDELRLINELVEVAYMASTHACIGRASAMSSFLDLISGRLKNVRATLDSYRTGQHTEERHRGLSDV